MNVHFTESTPLLTTLQTGQARPSIEDGIRAIQAQGICDFNPEELAQNALPTAATRTAYQLLVLLQWRVVVAQQGQRESSDDIWARHDRKIKTLLDIEVTDNRIMSVWKDFAQNYRTSQEIEDALWVQFPERTGGHLLRVVDLVDNGPGSLLMDGLVDLSLTRTWKCGLNVGPLPNQSLLSRIVRRYDKFGTPRVLNFLEVVADFVFLGCMAHYLLYPPMASIVKDDLGQCGSRECMLLTLALASLARAWTSRTLSSLVVVLSFLFSLPSVPLPDETSFLALHFAFILQILTIHLPSPFSPLLLAPANFSLPLMVFIRHSISRIFSPIVLFFVPVLVFATFLLSLSLADPTPNIILATTHLGPSPIQTRVASLILFVVVALLLLLSLAMGSATLPSLLHADMPHTSHARRWDRYSQRVGLDARRVFLHSGVWYSRPRYFPPPFNLLQTLFIRGPVMLLILLGYRRPFSRLQAAETALWRVTVGPVIMVSAGFWLWNFSR